MLQKIRYAIVAGLEASCDLLDRVPLYRRLPLMGRCRLARWSNKLDEKWDTGVWQPIGEIDLELPGR